MCPGDTAFMHTYNFNLLNQIFKFDFQKIISFTLSWLLSGYGKTNELMSFPYVCGRLNIVYSASVLSLFAQSPACMHFHIIFITYLLIRQNSPSAGQTHSHCIADPLHHRPPPQCRNNRGFMSCRAQSPASSHPTR